MIKRILVCGGRDYIDREAVYRLLDELLAKHAFLMVVHGDCPTGADKLADQWARSRFIQTWPFPADWKKHGRAAGPIRNSAMLDEAKPDLVVAFPGNTGTADMVKKARAAAGVDVLIAAVPQSKSEKSPWQVRGL